MFSLIFEQLAGLSAAMERPRLTRRDVMWPDVPGKIQAVTGMRRAGKTSFLFQTMGDFAARPQKSIPAEGQLYVNFEDERLRGLDGAQLGELVEVFYRRVPQRRGKEECLLCLDEIQLIPGWESFVRRLMDTEKVRIFVSGSSSRMLSREVASSLRGRGMETVVWPFSFREYLRHRFPEKTVKQAFWTPSEISWLEAQFDDYLSQGGFPETVGLAPMHRRPNLQGYVDACLFRDIVERHQVTNVEALRRLVRQLLASPGSLFSVHKFWNDMKSQGFPVAKETLHDYLSHLQDAFLLLAIPLETSSKRQRQVNPRKIYPCDPGLIPIFDRSGKTNTGHALETAVAIELKRRGAELSYARTVDDHEVDFSAVFPDGSRSLIQVAASVSDAGTLARELHPLQPKARFLGHHTKSSERLLLTGSMHAALSVQKSAPPAVNVLPAWAWMLKAG